MYQEVCFNRGTEAGGGRGGELMWSLAQAPQSFYACYGPELTFLVLYHLGGIALLNLVYVTALLY